MDFTDVEGIAALMNADSGGYAKTMGHRFVKAGPDEVVLEWTVGEEHLQPYGIVHGGVHCGAIETVCSVGAAMVAAQRGYQGGVVGLENHTSFLRAVRAGTKLRARATPITRGSTTQVWQADVVDESGAQVARGTVRLLCTPKIGN
jgi:1,4-dihydroxy-2-naphthoyl-CoA hydrolase